ncbi:HalOD1 output domain-containing protein [Haloferax namakaokahaiae]|uniref:HalOD1 output domain-containing protein n=1 Tax=Haloferax namakaokahaiae TaxID=1748331 RepID=A0ABD5ZC69_9EURY
MSKDTDDRATSDDSTGFGIGTNWSLVTQRQYEPEDGGELTAAIVYAIAEAKGVAPMELKSPPLYDSVDVPAIEAAFFGPDVTNGSRQGVGNVEFQYTDYLVKVRSDGWIQVYEATNADLP